MSEYDTASYRLPHERFPGAGLVKDRWLGYVDSVEAQFYANISCFGGKRPASVEIILAVDPLPLRRRDGDVGPIRHRLYSNHADTVRYNHDYAWKGDVGSLYVPSCLLDAPLPVDLYAMHSCVRSCEEIMSGTQPLESG